MASYDRFSERSSHDETDEPSLTSFDPNERKLARRLRIQRRLGELTKQKQPEVEEVLEKTSTEKQILISEKLLYALQEEGEEVLTNVKIASDARKLQRRKEAQEIRRALLKRLEEDDKECTEKYMEISEKWQDLLASKDPIDINTQMITQNQKCLEILAQKDRVIAELRQKLEEADLKFTNDQKKQNEEIDLLIERMENQIKILSKTHPQQLTLIDETLNAERQALLQTVAEKLDLFFKKVREEENEGVENRKEIMQECEVEMERVITQHHEEFRDNKIKLELEIQKLMQEVENMKVACLTNVERLNYGYAVLKQREGENAIVENQQKRRINKLQDTINSLKKNYVELKESSKVEVQKLTDQVVKTRKAILDLEGQSQHSTILNENKYLQIWDLNIKTANGLVEQILTADRIIYEQILGLEWSPPENGIPSKEDLESYKTVMVEIEKKKAQDRENKIICETYKPATTLEEINLERRMLKHIFKNITDRSGHLIEQSLREVLLPYTINDNVVIRLDNVFQALNITTVEQVGFLLHFFLPYVYCPTCTAPNMSSRPSDQPGESTSLSCSSELTDMSKTCGINEEFTLAESKLIEVINQEIEVARTGNCCVDNVAPDSPEESEKSSFREEQPDVHPSPSSCDAESKDHDIKSRFLCNKGHFLEIQTAYVTKAIRTFVERYHFVTRDDPPVPFGEKLIKDNLIISRNVTAEDVRKFWKMYRDIFPEEKERLWDGLLVGLKKYYEVLKKRHAVSVEIKNLRKQNAELRRLLNSHTIQPEHYKIVDNTL